MKNKKGIMGPVISVFVMILIISILAGLTFLFISGLKGNVVDTTVSTGTVINESGAYVNTTGYTITQSDNATNLEFRDLQITAFWANVSGVPFLVPAANYTLIGNVLYNATEVGGVGIDNNITYYSDGNVSYAWEYIKPSNANAFLAVNDTESAGAGIVGYLPLIFLAVIFGAILTLVLRIILPYINLGNKMEGF